MTPPGRTGIRRLSRSRTGAGRTHGRRESHPMLCVLSSLAILATVSGGARAAGETAPTASTPLVASTLPSASLYHWQDFDRDGLQDVYVQGPGADRLLRNTGGG